MTSQTIDKLIELSKEYSKISTVSIMRNSHMNEINYVTGYTPDKRLNDAVIVDFMNFIASKTGIDLAMYTEDLQGQELNTTGL